MTTENMPLGRQTVCVVGLGYIGLPTAATLARSGYAVIGYDISEAAVESVNSGKAHFAEPGLDDLVHDVVESGLMRAVLEPPAADIYLIAVPTPVGPQSQPDLKHVFDAAEAIAPHLKAGVLVLLESTSPIGATRQMIARLAAARPDLRFPNPNDPAAGSDVYVAYSPERVIPGRTLEELASNARVIGGATPEAAQRAAAVYRALTAGELLLTDDRSAECVKLTENAFRDVNIAFANELSLICDRLGLDVWTVIRLANKHPRVDILRPGAGVGGHCIAVDPWFLVASAPEQARLIRTAREVNDSKPDFVIGKVKALMDADPSATLGCLGLTFKPDVGDFRESAALSIAQQLSALYPGRVVCADPFDDELEDPSGLTLTSTDHAMACSVVVALVSHKDFRRPTPPMGRLVDACGLWQ